MKCAVLFLVLFVAACTTASPPAPATNVSKRDAVIRPSACQCSDEYNDPEIGGCFDNDSDDDCVCLHEDNCPGTPNCDRANADSDAFGDLCDEFPNTPDPEGTIAGLDSRIDALESVTSASVPSAYPDVNCNGIAASDEGACDGLTVNLLGTLAICSVLLDNVRPCDEYVDTTGGSNTPAVCNTSVATVLDLDKDGLGNACDNCDADYNPTQADGDLDGTGDACE